MESENTNTLLDKFSKAALKKTLKRANGGTGGGFLNNNNYEKENGGGGDSDLGVIGATMKGGCHPSIEALTAACSKKLLNREYLLQGDGSPFVGGDETVPLSEGNGIPSTSKQEEEEDNQPAPVKASSPKEEESTESKRPTIILHSQKMKELKDLLLAEKLNTHAISLHLTAQSQVQVGKKGRNDTDTGGGIRPKRARRE